MKNIKSLLIALCFALAAIGAQAATITGALTSTKEATIKYWSVDAKNQPIELSVKIYYKDSEDIKFVILNNHPTITHAEGAPSGSSPQMEAIKYMVSENALVVCTDYIGFGETSQKVLHPYMCSTLTARNILDAYKAAVKWMKEQKYGLITKKNYKFDANYYTINIGYSQGGTNTLAFQRYLETKATDADRKLVNLAGSVCGAGVYDQQIVFDTYEKMDKLDYPILMLYVLQGQLEAFGETIMRDLTLEECFTPEFWAYCQNGFLTKLREQKTNVDDLNKELKDNGFGTFSSIMNEAYADRSSKLYRTIKKTFEESNLLAEGWEPSAPIIFYHDKAGHDIVVPYAETEAAMERFEGHCKYVDAITDYGYDGTGELKTIREFPFVSYVVTGENYLWHPAVFRENWNYDAQHPGQETVQGAAAISGNESYNFGTLDHRTFGARFYAQFLGECKNIRPNIVFPEYFASIQGEGTAATQNIDPAGVEVKEIGTDGVVTAGDYDRISIALPNEVAVGEPIYVNFPATVDGYTFGCNAERYHLTVVDGVATEINPMDDFDNFEAGETYLVVPEVAVESPVYSYTAGVRTHCLGVSAPCVIDNEAIVLNYSIGDLARLVDKLNAGSYIYKLEHVGKMKNGILETENK